MNPKITEDTRIRSGEITINGRKRKYVMFINPGTNAAENTVDLIIHNFSGMVVDAMRRDYDRYEHTYLTDVVKAALKEYKDFVK